MQKATEKQMSYIAMLGSKLGLGRYPDQVVKSVQGKNKIGGISMADASQIIDQLKARLK